MKDLYRHLLLWMAVFALSSAELIAQDLRTSIENRNRPEEDNISGLRDDPTLVNFQMGMTSQDGSEGNGSTEVDGSGEENPNRQPNQPTRPDLTMDIYPNPASSFLQLNFGTEDDVHITLHNLMGKEVYHYSGKLDNHRVELIGFNPGVYFVTVHNQEDRVVRKVRITP